VIRVEEPMGSRIVPLADLSAMNDEVRAEISDAWDEILIHSRFIGGDAVALFEEQWARYCGSRYAVSLANGTDAIELTLRALGIGTGDEVVVPANTFVATVEAIVLCGAIPRFVDVDPETLLVTPEIVRAAITPRTAALIAVELYGNVPRMVQLAQLAASSGIALIEDAAQAHGSTLNGRPAGSFGVAGCFSFYPTKNLGAWGDGGAVVTNDRALAEAIRSLGNHGRIAGAPHIHRVVARNSRLDALQAAVLTAKLWHLDDWNNARRAAMEIYRRALPHEAVHRVHVDPHVSSSYHQHVVLVPHREAVREHLSRNGVQTGVHYPIPCHMQRAYRQFAHDRLPVAEASAEQVLSLPLFPHMTEQQILRVCDVLRACLDDMAAGSGARLSHG
jgi:dTDP-4-amino-4,6-dideoxygalactose transaminase